MKEALFYEKLDNSKVRCMLCPHECVLSQDGTGVCRARRNTDGCLHSLNYSCVTSVALDPIEKKPLYHFHPGSMILSAGTFGCNFKCSWCQNWTIAHTDARTMELTPAGLADLARQYASGEALAWRIHITNPPYGTNLYMMQPGSSGSRDL
jgi:pyruvate formate lyase activating enzyme